MRKMQRTMWSPCDLTAMDYQRAPAASPFSAPDGRSYPSYRSSYQLLSIPSECTSYIDNRLRFNWIVRLGSDGGWLEHRWGTPEGKWGQSRGLHPCGETRKLGTGCWNR